VIIIKKEIICDISNVACYNKRNEKPKLKYIDLLYNKIPDKFELIGIADCSLYHQIDEKKRYKREYLNTKLILEAPASTRADDFILPFAYINENLIISNDRFKQYDFISEDWLKTHRISFMIINDQLILQRPLRASSKDNIESQQKINTNLFLKISISKKKEVIS